MKLTASITFALILSLTGCTHSAEPDAAPSLAEIDSLIKQRDWPQAVARLEELHTERGADPKVLLRLATAYAAKDDLAKAITRLREGIEAHPEAGSLYAPLAQLYIRLGQHAPAREVLEQGRARGVGDGEIAMALGMCLGQMGELDGAALEFDRALAAGNDERVVHLNQAVVLAQKKEHEKARALLEGILAKDPTYAPAQRELARALIALYPDKREAVDRALGLCWDAKERLRDDWHVYEVMGDGWMLVGDFNAAVDSYTEALRLGGNPKSVEDRYVLARQRQKAQQEQKKLEGDADVAKDAQSAKQENR